MISKNTLNNYLRKFNFEIHGTSYIQSLKKGEFKSNEFDFFKKIFGTDKITIFDVGANRGVKITEFLKLFPSSLIYAFEPYTPLIKELEKQFLNNPNIRLFNIGISDKKKEMVFNVNKGVDTSSFLTSNKTGLNSDKQVHTIEQVILPLDTLDQIVLNEKIEKINILKLDIQGSELNALRGAEKLLGESRIDIIFTEAYFIKQYIDQPLFYEIASYLQGFGYLLQDIYNPIYGKGKLAWCDAIFVRENLNC